MTVSAARKARRCFALAASTTFPAERETAVARGLAILESAGLDPDDFDIPGRERKIRVRDATFAHGDGRGPYSPFHEYGSETERRRQAEREAFRRAAEGMGSQSQSAQHAAAAFAEAMRGFKFAVDDALRDAIREAMEKRHGRVWRGEPEYCPHGNDVHEPCDDCRFERQMASHMRCRHGRLHCRTCAELDGFGDD